jgi:demethylmenaquinone methyltransferase/2-methoxy-6-polyprenyl-1,4-benzoquinol methylase
MAEGVGIDLAEKMLEIGRQKIANQNLQDKLSLSTGDAADIPFPESSFDAVTMAFGIRNLEHTIEGLREIYRVLKPEGRAIILEFSLPESYFLRGLYLFYFRRLLPKIGRVISGDSYAYRYLNETVETFPFGEDFCNLMINAGFSDVKATRLTFGIATVYHGNK